MNKTKKHIAITGTKGKTTSLRIAQHIFLMKEISVWGSYGLDGRYHDGRVFMKRDDCVDYLKVEKPSDIHLSEATSFILTLENIYQEDSLDVAVFTSFDPLEHMEIHRNSKQYLEDKLNIFKFLKKDGVAIINSGIEQFEEIKSRIDQKIVTYGISSDSDYWISNFEQNMFGSRFNLNHKGKEFTIESKLVSEVNALNITAAIISTVESEHIDIEEAISLVASFPGVKGRFNFFKITDSDNEVVIDYAHTPESLEETLKTLKAISNKRIICIFGCGGNKSIEKRSPMGMIAEKYSDKVIITNDNPRNESPHKIANDILRNVKNKNKFETILDRDLAIKSTLHENHGSIILIAGKGAEHEINFGKLNFPHNDHNSVLTYAISNQYVMLKANQYVD